MIRAPRLRKSNHAIDCAFSRSVQPRWPQSKRTRRSRCSAPATRRPVTKPPTYSPKSPAKRPATTAIKTRQAVATAAGRNVLESRHHPREPRRTRQGDRGSEHRDRLGSGLGARARQSRQRLLPLQPPQRSGSRLQPGDHVVTRRSSPGLLQPRAVAPRARREPTRRAKDFQQAATLAPEAYK